MKNTVHAACKFSWPWLVSLAALLLFGAALKARAADSAPAGNAVLSVEPATLPGGRLVVRIGLKEPLKASPFSFSVGKPPRIAMDLPDTANALGKNTVSVNQGPLGSINVVQAGNRTRLVFNLNQAAKYDTQLQGKYLLVGLGATATETAGAGSEHFAEPVAAGAHHAIRSIDFQRGADGGARIVTTLSDSQAGVNIREDSKGVVVDFINTELPKSLQRKADVSSFGTPVQYVESYALGDNTRMFIHPTGNWDYSAYQMDNQFVVDVKPVKTGQNMSGKPKYTGEKLSLNFQNVDVRSVLQVIADFTGLNIVASDSVTGSLTLRLKDVPWDQALHIILEAKGLGMQKSGNVIWVAPKEEILAREKQELAGKEAVEALEPLVTEYIPLNYLRADDAQSILYGYAAGAARNSANNSVDCSTQAQGITASTTTNTMPQQTAAQQGGGTSGSQKILSKRGRATYDLKTNTLIVTDTPQKIQQVRQLLAKLDVPTRQVMIEARVVLATSNWSRELGARLGIGAGGQLPGANRVGIGGDLGSSATNANLAPGSTASFGALGSNVNLPAPDLTSSIGFSLLNTVTGNLLSLELSAMEANDEGKVISSPRVVTSNQRPAVIIQGTQIPYVTVQASAGTAPVYTVAFKDVNLCLLVDPQILNNNNVILNVEIQKDSVGQLVALPGSGSVPSIDTRRVKTQVRVANGETAVIGGIYEQTISNNIGKVPLLGDMPFLGHLFKNTVKQDQKVELLVFLTPRILSSQVALH